MEFEYDPFWDDGEDWSYEGVDDEYGDIGENKFPDIVDKVPDDDEKIIDITKTWVAKLMSE